MISIIICSIDPEKFGRVTRNYAALMEGEAHEIIGIHDARSLAEGYNRGIRQSRGSILVFCHDDIEILSLDFASRIKRHLQSFDVVGPVGTSRVVDGFWPRAGAPFLHGQVAVPAPPAFSPAKYIVNFFGSPSPGSLGTPLVPAIQALDGLFFALRRPVAEEIGFDEETFDGFHGYDIDFTYRAFLAGFRLAVHNDIAIIHQSKPGNFDDSWHAYNVRFKSKHAASLPVAATPSAPHDDWLSAGCADKGDVLRSFDPEVQLDLASRYASPPAAAPAPRAEPGLLGRLLRMLRR